MRLDRERIGEAPKKGPPDSVIFPGREDGSASAILKQVTRRKGKIQ
jgi:hypothetical protein